MLSQDLLCPPLIFYYSQKREVRFKSGLKQCFSVNAYKFSNLFKDKPDNTKYFCFPGCKEMHGFVSRCKCEREHIYAWATGILPTLCILVSSVLLILHSLCAVK